MNKNLFSTTPGKLLPNTDATNHEGGKAYAFTAKHALAQYAATGCMSRTFYASAEAQLADVVLLCDQVEASFVAKTAVYAREKGHMKDVPALLTALLSMYDAELLVKVFPRVIDNAKMLRNFVQIMRSGAAYRKSLGSRPKRLVREWLAAKSDDALFKDSVGASPSLGDIVKMVHPKPADEARKALYGYLIGKKVDEAKLPALVREYEAFKADPKAKVPEVPFQLLTSLELSKAQWIEIAKSAGWTMTRMNLNTFARHGVFEEKHMAHLIAKRLADPELVKKAKVFPYQLMVAHRMTAGMAGIPAVVSEALQDAMEIAIANVPRVDGKVYVLPDVSGSMSSPLTGHREGATTAVRCIDVAALVAAAFMRKNSDVEVLPFEHRVVPMKLNPRDSVMTNARKLASIGGGGTSCSAPLALLNEQKAQGDLVLFVSDNESWVDAQAGRGTATMTEWTRFKQRNPAAKLVCIDLQPYGTTQAKEQEDILNIGGFSDQVFEVISDFAAGTLGADHWVGVIEQVVL